MGQQKFVVILLFNTYLTSFVCAQYGSHFSNSNPGYSVATGDYGYKGQNLYGGASAGSDGNSEPEPFNFAYQVKNAPTNTYFQHEANSDGKRVTGAYSVLLPDGRNQVVTYVADENGYNAKVSYEGEAKPQPSQPGSPGGYPSAPGFPSAAPSYSTATHGYPSAAPGYPSAAPGYPSAVFAPRPQAEGPGGHSGSGYSFSSYDKYSPQSPSYIVRVPSFQNGIKGSPQPKTGNDYE